METKNSQLKQFGILLALAALVLTPSLKPLVDARQVVSPPSGGPMGPQGPSGTMTLGTVTPVAPPGPPWITNTGTADNSVLNFGLVRGNDGTNGTNGTNGSAATIAVGTVSTGAPGSSATVVNSGTSGAAVFDISIPRGNAGSNGSNGSNGNAATIAVGTVTGLAPGASPTVVNAGTSSAATFNFGIPAGATGATGSTGATGPAGFSTVTPAASTRVIGTAFRPSTTNAVLVIYTIKAQTTNPLLVGTSTAEVILYSDTNTTPTTERGRVGASSGVGLTVTVALTTSNTATLIYLVPAGHYVLLSSSISGTGAVSIVSQTEEVLG